MYEYSLGDIDSTFKTTLFHNDKYTKKEFLEIIIKITDTYELSKDKENLFVDIVFYMCEKFGFLTEDMMEYMFFIKLDFEDRKSLDVDVRENIYLYE